MFHVKQCCTLVTDDARFQGFPAVFRACAGNFGLCAVEVGVVMPAGAKFTALAGVLFCCALVFGAFAAVFGW